MGHHGGAGPAQREILQLLRRHALPRHLLQHHVEAQDALLHGQFDHPVRRHFLSLRARLLPAGRFRREDVPLCLHPPLPHCVLLAPGRDYPADVADRPSPGQIPPIHDDTGDAVRPGDDHSAQRQLPLAVDPPDGALGQTRLYRILAQTAVHHPAAQAAAAQRMGAQCPADARDGDLHHPSRTAPTLIQRMLRVLAAQLFRRWR